MGRAEGRRSVTVTDPDTGEPKEPDPAAEEAAAEALLASLRRRSRAALAAVIATED